MADIKQPTNQTTTEERPQTTMRFPEDVYEALRERAFRTRQPQNQIVTEALRQYLGVPDPTKATEKAASTAQSETVKTVPPIKALEDAAHKAPFFRNKEK